MLTPLINLSIITSTISIFVYSFIVMFAPSAIWLSRTTSTFAKWSIISMLLLLVIRFFTPARVR